MEKIRVLVVDDSFFMRKIINDMLRSDPQIEVVGEAADGKAALEAIAVLQPNVITLDIQMPGMNGLEALRAIVSEPHHPSVVMLSGYVQEGAALTLECLALGAADFIVKPSGSFSLDIDKVKDVLLAKIKTAAAADTSKLPNRPPAHVQSGQYSKTGGVVVIGASTGGPAALEALLPEFPSNFPYPIIVAQHLPREFVASFSARLQKTCQLAVKQAEDGVAIKPGTIYIASGGTTTTVEGAKDGPRFDVVINFSEIQTPSITKLMTTAADAYGPQTIGVILTGMGDDGSEGMAHIKQVGGTTVVQDEATSIVFGMGKVVVQQGTADHIVALGDICKTIGELLR